MIIAWWGILGAVVAVFAWRQGHTGWKWLGFALVFWPLAVLQLYASAPMKKREESSTAKRNWEVLKGLGFIALIVVDFSIVTGLLSATFGPAHETVGTTTTTGSHERRGMIVLSDGRTVRSAEAQSVCRQKVRERLVSPSSAKFAGRFSSEWRDPVQVGNSWNVYVTVDSQNGFGAIIRSQWLCVLDATSDSIVVNQLQ